LESSSRGEVTGQRGNEVMDKTITLFNLLTLGLASAAFFLSCFNLWASQFRRGRVLLTQPTIFFFGWDRNKDIDAPKIMFRSALFSSGSRGRLIENLSATVRTEDGEFEFSFWGYDEGKGMVRGSGIFVGSNGFVAYHHFNPISDEHAFAYTGKKYEIEIFAKLFNQSRGTLLGKYQLDLNDSAAEIGLAHGEGGVMWNWSPNEKRYCSAYSERPNEWSPAAKKLVGVEL
jgi:hypothetical protein